MKLIYVERYTLELCGFGRLYDKCTWYAR